MSAALSIVAKVFPAFIVNVLELSSRSFRPQIQDSGLVFGAAYTILEVLDSYGEQLIKLRNPPGNHEVRKIRKMKSCR